MNLCTSRRLTHMVCIGVQDLLQLVDHFATGHRHQTDMLQYQFCLDYRARSATAQPTNSPQLV